MGHILSLRGYGVHTCSVLALGIFLLAGGVMAPALARAQEGAPALPGSPDSFTYCSTYQSGKAVPNGFGAAYNPHSSGKETMLKSLCESATFRPYVDSVGIDTRNIAIYKYGYHWNGSSWVRYEYIPADGSAQAAGDWLSQSVRGQNDISYAGDVTYWVAYACVRANNAWKCGCRDGSCSKSYWNMQGAARQAASKSEEKNTTSLKLSVTPSKVEYVDPTKGGNTTLQKIKLKVRNTTDQTQTANTFTLWYLNHCTNKWEKFAYPFNISTGKWKPGEEQTFEETITKQNNAAAAAYFAKLRYPVSMRIVAAAYPGSEWRAEMSYFSNTFELVPPGCADPSSATPPDACSPIPTACPSA